MFISMSRWRSQQVSWRTSSRSTYGPAPSGNISSTAGFITVEFDWSFKGIDEQKLKPGQVTIDYIFLEEWMLQRGLNYTGSVVQPKYLRRETIAVTDKGSGVTIPNV